MTDRGIVICADDFGISEATNAVILELLKDRTINATTCLVETDTWPKAAETLRTLCDSEPGLAIGLHLNLTEQFCNAAPRAAQPLPYWFIRSAFPLSAQQAREILASIRNQWTLFCAHFGRHPDFIDGHQHIHLFPPVRTALMRVIRDTGFDGWVRQCRTSSNRSTSKRVVLDHLSVKLVQEAQDAGLRVNPGFGGVRAFRGSEDLEGIWKADLEAMAEGGVLMTHPGALGDCRDTHDIDACRIAEAKLLSGGFLAKILNEAGLGLSSRPRSPDWVPKGVAE